MNRQGSVGCSALHHLWSLEPYGCRRRLWYEATGTPADFPVISVGAIARGNDTEDINAKAIAKREGWKIERRKKLMRDKVVPYLTAHLDRVRVEPKPMAVIELKCPGEFALKRYRRDGLGYDYILQGQGYMAVTGYTECVYGIWDIQKWEPIVFTVERKENLISEIRAEVPKFQKLVEDGIAPDRLPAEDKRCAGCSWRTTCQGAAMLEQLQDEPDAPEYDSSLEVMIEQFIDAKEIASQADEYADQCRAKLAEAIGDRQHVCAATGRVTFRPVTSKRIDTKALRAKEPQIAKEFERTSISRTLRVYPQY